MGQGEIEKSIARSSQIKTVLPYNIQAHNNILGVRDQKVSDALDNDTKANFPQHVPGKIQFQKKRVHGPHTYIYIFIFLFPKEKIKLFQ